MHFKCSSLCCYSKNGLAMGASLIVTLAILLLKENELPLLKNFLKLTLMKGDLKGVCPRCQKKVTNQTKGVECKACLNWYQLSCVYISESE